jgi:hypothetical protein
LFVLLYSFLKVEAIANLLEQEAERLKAKYPLFYHPTIEHNLEWVSEEMTLKEGSVSISEGLIAMSTGLPSLTPKRPKTERKRGGTKRMSKR